MTRLYRAMVDGKPVTMLAISGLDYQEAWRYCQGVFGRRLEALEEIRPRQ